MNSKLFLLIAAFSAFSFTACQTRDGATVTQEERPQLNEKIVVQDDDLEDDLSFDVSAFRSQAGETTLMIVIVNEGSKAAVFDYDFTWMDSNGSKVGTTQSERVILPGDDERVLEMVYPESSASYANESPSANLLNYKLVVKPTM